MKSVIPFFLIASFAISPYVIAENSPLPQKEIQVVAPVSAPEKGEIVGYFDTDWQNFSNTPPTSGAGYVRKVLRTYENNSIEIQDFYYPSLAKQIDPIIVQKTDNIFSDSYAAPQEGTTTAYYEKGGIKWVNVFRNGSVIAVNEWNEAGEMTESIQWDKNGNIIEMMPTNQNNIIGYFDVTGEIFSKTLETGTSGMIRKQLRVLDNGDIELQDFYYPSMKKQTDPFIVDKQTDLTSGSAMPKQGQITLFYENGNPQWRIFFREGRQNGLMQNWFENGQQKLELYLIDDTVISKIEWDENGALIEQSNTFDDESTTREQAMSQYETIGYFDREWQNFSKNQISETGFVRKKLRTLENGDIEFQDFYYPSMNKQTDPLIVEASSDIESSTLMPKNGLVIGYFENGNMEWSHHESDGKRNGVAKTWYSNGNLESIQTYVNDKKEGIAAWFYNDGTKQIEALYENDELLSLQNWDTAGNRVDNKQPSATYEAGDPKATTTTGNIIGYFEGENWEIFSETAPKSGKGFVREQLRVLENGDIEVQDFYYPSMKKQMDPIIVSHKSDIKANNVAPDSGVVTTYYEEGQRKDWCEFKNGKVNGMCREWYPNGQLALEAIFDEAGIPINVKRWDESGKAINQ